MRLFSLVRRLAGDHFSSIARQPRGNLAGRRGYPSRLMASPSAAARLRADVPICLSAALLAIAAPASAQDTREPPPLPQPQPQPVAQPAAPSLPDATSAPSAPSAASSAAPAEPAGGEAAARPAPAVDAPGGPTSVAPSLPRTDGASPLVDPEAGEAGERLGEARFTDAHADHVILMPTAETHPAGTLYFSDDEIEVLQLGFAPTNRLQVTVTGLAPLLRHQVGVFDVAGKLNVLRTDVVRVAVYGGVTAYADHPDEGTFRAFGRVGAVAQACFTRLCRSSVSLNASALLGRVDDMQQGTPMYLAAGGTFGLSRVFSILLEPGIGLVPGGAPSDTPRSSATERGSPASVGGSTSHSSSR